MEIAFADDCAPEPDFAPLAEFFFTFTVPEEFEVTSGAAIETAHPTSASTPRGLTASGLDGERLGRLAWVPGSV